MIYLYQVFSNSNYQFPIFDYYAIRFTRPCLQWRVRRDLCHVRSPCNPVVKDSTLLTSLPVNTLFFDFLQGYHLFVTPSEQCIPLFLVFNKMYKAHHSRKPADTIDPLISISTRAQVEARRHPGEVGHIYYSRISNLISDPVRE